MFVSSQLLSNELINLEELLFVWWETWSDLMEIGGVNVNISLVDSGFSLVIFL